MNDINTHFCIIKKRDIYRLYIYTCIFSMNFVLYVYSVYVTIYPFLKFT